MTEQKKRHYVGPDPETIKREVEKHFAKEERILSELEPALRQAYKRNTYSLSSLLYEMADFGQWTLSEGHLKALADVIRRLGKQKRGNPGNVAINDVEVAHQRIIGIARKDLAPIRRRNNGRVPHGTIPRTVSRVIEAMTDSGRLDRQTRRKLNRKYICSTLKARKTKAK